MFLCITIAFILAAFSCGGDNRRETVTSKERVKVLVAKKETMQPEYATFGTVVYFNKADVFPTAEGNVEKLYVEEGARVRKGQILAQLAQKKLLISREEAQAQVNSKRALLDLAAEKLKEAEKGVEAKLISIRNAEAELEQKNNEYENISTTYENKKKLFEAGGITREELESVKTQFLSYKTRLLQAKGDLEIQKLGFRDEDIVSSGYALPNTEDERFKLLLAVNTRMIEAERKVAEAELNSALLSLKTINLYIEETIIKAPIDGTVGTRYLDIGEKATPQDKLFTLFNSDRVYVQVEVSEKELSRLAEDQEAYIRRDADGSAEIKGRLTLIAPIISPDTRTTRIKILAANKDRKLTPGLFVRVRIITGKPEKRILLPEESITSDEKENKHVFLVRKGRLFKQGIKTGTKMSNNMFAVESGIDEGEQVCMKPQASYSDGMEVEASP